MPIKEKQNEAVIEKEDIQDLATDTIDLTKFSSSKSKSVSRISTEAGVMSVINSKENGKRITLSKELMEKLNYPKQLQFAFAENSIAIGEALPENEIYFNIKISGKKGIVYAGQLVNEITNEFALDFSDKVSMTFHEAKYLSHGESVVAVVTIK